MIRKLSVFFSKMLLSPAAGVLRSSKLEDGLNCFSESSFLARHLGFPMLPKIRCNYSREATRALICND
jgi:hypothetical protein